MMLESLVMPKKKRKRCLSGEHLSEPESELGQAHQQPRSPTVTAGGRLSGSGILGPHFLPERLWRWAPTDIPQPSRPDLLGLDGMGPRWPLTPRLS